MASFFDRLRFDGGGVGGGVGGGEGEGGGVLTVKYGRDRDRVKVVKARRARQKAGGQADGQAGGPQVAALLQIRASRACPASVEMTPVHLPRS